MQNSLVKLARGASVHVRLIDGVELLVHKLRKTNEGLQSCTIRNKH